MLKDYWQTAGLKAVLSTLLNLEMNSLVSLVFWMPQKISITQYQFEWSKTNTRFFAFFSQPALCGYHAINYTGKITISGVAISA